MALLDTFNVSSWSQNPKTGETSARISISSPGNKTQQYRFTDPSKAASFLRSISGLIRIRKGNTPEEVAKQFDKAVPLFKSKTKESAGIKLSKFDPLATTSGATILVGDKAYTREHIPGETINNPQIPVFLVRDVKGTGAGNDFFGYSAVPGGEVLSTNKNAAIGQAKILDIANTAEVRQRRENILQEAGLTPKDIDSFYDIKIQKIGQTELNDIEKQKSQNPEFNPSSFNRKSLVSKKDRGPSIKEDIFDVDAAEKQFAKEKTLPKVAALEAPGKSLPSKSITLEQGNTFDLKREKANIQKGNTDLKGKEKVKRIKDIDNTLKALDKQKKRDELDRRKGESERKQQVERDKAAKKAEITRQGKLKIEAEKKLMEEEQKRLKEAAPKEKRETKNQIEADRLSRKETLTQKEQERLEELDNNPEVDTTPERKEEQKRKLDDFLKQEEEINKKEEIVVDKEDNLIDRPEIDRPDGRKTFTDKEGTVFVDINNDGEVSANEINDQKREQAGTEEQDQSLKEEEQRLRDLVANPPEEIIKDPELFKLYLGQNEQGKALIIASLDVMKQGDDEQKKLFNEALKTAQDSAGITFRQNLRVAENALGNFIDDLNQDFGNTVERLDRQKTEIAAQMGDVDIETQQSLLQESQRLDAQRNQLASQGLGVSSFAQQTGARSGDIFRGVERQRTVQQRQLAGREAEREQSTRELQEMKTRQLREKALQAEEFFGTKRFEDIVADDPGKLGGLLGFQVGRVGGAPNITGSLEAQRRLDEQRRRQSLQEQFKLKQFNI